MDWITKIFDLNFEKLVPEMGVVLEKTRLLLTLLVLIGPLILLGLGIAYLMIPTKEANYKFGYRTYFGMGGVEAWRFTQRIAGLSFCTVGAILLLVMFVVVSDFGSRDHFQMVSTTMTCLLWQVGVVVLIRLTIGILAAVFFDGYGNRRREKRDY